MNPSPARTSLSLVFVSLTIAVGSVQPPNPSPVRRIPSEPSKLGPAGTAFPELKPIPLPKPFIRLDEKWDPGKNDSEIHRAIDALLARLYPSGIVILDTPLRRLRYEQVREGLAALWWFECKIAIDNWHSPDSGPYVRFVTDLYRAAGELEPTLVGRIPGFEMRVVHLKSFEAFFAARFEAGNEPQHNVELARFYRLQAEADLLRLQAVAEREGTRVGSERTKPGEAPKPDRNYAAYTLGPPSDWRYSHTAFPDVKPPPRAYAQRGFKGDYTKAWEA